MLLFCRTLHTECLFLRYVCSKALGAAKEIKVLVCKQDMCILDAGTHRFYIV